MPLPESAPPPSRAPVRSWAAAAAGGVAGAEAAWRRVPPRGERLRWWGPARRARWAAWAERARLGRVRVRVGVRVRVRVRVRMRVRVRVRVALN